MERRFMTEDQAERWLLRYLTDKCPSPDRAGAIRVDRHWTKPEEVTSPHGKAIAAALC